MHSHPLIVHSYPLSSKQPLLLISPWIKPYPRLSPRPNWDLHLRSIIMPWCTDSLLLAWIDLKLIRQIPFSMPSLNLSVHTVARDICPRIAGRCMDIQDSRTLNLEITLTKVVNPSDLTDLRVIPVHIITGMRVITSILEITREKESLMWMWLKEMVLLMSWTWKLTGLTIQMFSTKLPW